MASDPRNYILLNVAAEPHGFTECLHWYPEGVLHHSPGLALGAYPGRATTPDPLKLPALALVRIGRHVDLVEERAHELEHGAVFSVVVGFKFGERLRDRGGCGS